MLAVLLLLWCLILLLLCRLADAQLEECPGSIKELLPLIRRDIKFYLATTLAEKGNPSRLVVLLVGDEGPSCDQVCLLGVVSMRAGVTFNEWKFYEKYEQPSFWPADVPWNSQFHSSGFANKAVLEELWKNLKEFKVAHLVRPPHPKPEIRSPEQLHLFAFTDNWLLLTNLVFLVRHQQCA